MHKACLLSELAPGEAIRLDTAPPFTVFQREDSGILNAPPVKLPVRTHKVPIVDGTIMAIESDGFPNFPRRLTPTGHA